MRVTERLSRSSAIALAVVSMGIAAASAVVLGRSLDRVFEALSWAKFASGPLALQIKIGAFLGLQAALGVLILVWAYRLFKSGLLTLARPERAPEYMERCLPARLRRHASRDLAA